MGAPVHVAPGTLSGLTTTTRALGVSIDGYGLKANDILKIESTLVG